MSALLCRKHPGPCGAGDSAAPGGTGEPQQPGRAGQAGGWAGSAVITVVSQQQCSVGLPPGHVSGKRAHLCHSVLLPALWASSHIVANATGFVTHRHLRCPTDNTERSLCLLALLFSNQACRLGELPAGPRSFSLGCLSWQHAVLPAGAAVHGVQRQACTVRYVPRHQAGRQDCQGGAAGRLLW